MTGGGGRILVVDDDPAICLVVSEALKRAGYLVKAVGTIAERTAQIAAFAPEVLVTDVVLPDGDGMDDVAQLIADDPDLRIIVLSAQNTLNTAVRATGQGAFEYLPKPFDLHELTRAVGEALASRGSGAEAAQPGLDEAAEALPLIGRSSRMQAVYRTIARVVANDLNILILGESGTGKELVAQAIHDLGPRRDKPFVPINMAAIPRELIEAELFGYERGAFTGALARTAGKFEQAQGGSLFLDEIGDMPIEAQTRLLRVLQSGEVTTVGGARPVRVDVRIVAATNQDLPALITAGRFREDLYYRLNVVPIEMPPLRERAEDISLLARHFLDLAAREGLPRKSLDDEAAQLLSLHAWPGNVRELQNLMQRMTVLTRDSVISGAQVRELLAVSSAETDLGGTARAHLAEAATLWARERLVVGSARPVGDLHTQMLAVVERALIAETLAAVDGNQIRAAAILGINRNTLRKKLTMYDLDPLQIHRRG